MPRAAGLGLVGSVGGSCGSWAQARPPTARKPKSNRVKIRKCMVLLISLNFTSRHYNHVPWFQHNVVFGPFAFDDLLVIERVLDLLTVLGAKDVDALDFGELGKATTAGNGLQGGHIRQEREGSGLDNFPGAVNAAAVNLGDDDGDLGRGDVLSETVADDAGQLHGGQACGLHIVQQRQGDFSVGADGNGAGNIRFLPDIDTQNVLWTDFVIRADAGGRSGRRGCRTRRRFRTSGRWRRGVGSVLRVHADGDEQYANARSEKDI